MRKRQHLNYFCNIADNLLKDYKFDKNLNNNDLKNKLNITADSKQPTLDNLILEKKDIKKAINELPNKQSTGSDGIKICWIKDNLEKFSDILTPLFNK